jgi:hypothetical protein
LALDSHQHREVAGPVRLEDLKFRLPAAEGLCRSPSMYFWAACDQRAINAAMSCSVISVDVICVLRHRPYR